MSDRVRIGRVGRPHGIDGAFFVEQPSENKGWWKTGASFLAGDQRVEVVAHRMSSGRPVIKLDKDLPRGTELEIERAELPPTDEDEYYAFELVGLAVREESGRELGTVKTVAPGVANDVLELDSGVLLPMVEDCVREIDLDARRIVIASGFAS
jgi:16S rRNA processing protein RimM